jgi:hypothetical protein
MIDPQEGITPYDLSYSGEVRDELAALIRRARTLGRHEPLTAAARTIDYRLRIYPQSGQPIRYLWFEDGQEWIGVVAPLVVRYLIYESRRLVFVVRPMQTLRGAVP